MSLVTIDRDYQAGFGAGRRDGRDGKPVSLFPEQRSTRFGRGYVAGYRTALVGTQETWIDYVADLLLAHDLTHANDGSDKV